MVAHKKTHHSSFSLHLFFNNTAEIREGDRWCFNILLLIVLMLQGLCYKSQTMGFEHAVSCQGTDLRLWWRCYICWPMHKEWTPTASKRYNMQFNNFYTLQSLLRTCFISISRLVELKKEKEKKGVGKRKRKAMKWVRHDSCLTLQWKDNRPVTNQHSKRVCPYPKENVTTVSWRFPRLLPLAPPPNSNCTCTAQKTGTDELWHTKKLKAEGRESHRASKCKTRDCQLQKQSRLICQSRDVDQSRKWVYPSCSCNSVTAHKWTCQPMQW